VAGLRDRSRIDRLLAQAQHRGVRLGVYGSSRVWFWIAVFAWVSRRMRRAVGSEPLLVFRDELRPGEVVQISHVPETYQGKRVGSRRRRIVSS
jgi:hypothetical protein